MQDFKVKKIQKFARYEFKYLLNKKLRKLIEEDIHHFMAYDGFVHPELDNSYFVRSLYFDNNLSSNFFEKVDGIKKRSKYRIRTYSKIDGTDIPIFLEKKGRVNERTFKERVEIEREYLTYFLNPNYHHLILDKLPNNKLAEEFVFDSIRKRLEPKVLIDYKRRPYINNYGLYFRLTFDSEVVSRTASNLFPSKDSGSFQECRAGYTILELKFDRGMPPWFHRIIQNYNLRRLSISKFVIGMEQCGIAEDF